MTINLDTLRKTAEAEETQKWGGWAFDEDDFDGFCIYINDGDNFGRSYVAKDLTQGESEGESTAEFIATFDPPTVLALLSRLEQAEQQVQAVLRLADSWETGALRWEDPLRVPNEVFLLRKALHQPTHEPDWTDYQLGDPGASCSCGYNGPYKECWQSRRALDGDSNE